jgi:hypothetical protein
MQYGRPLHEYCRRRVDPRTCLPSEGAGLPLVADFRRRGPESECPVYIAYLPSSDAVQQVGVDPSTTFALVVHQTSNE